MGYTALLGAAGLYYVAVLGGVLFAARWGIPICCDVSSLGLVAGSRRVEREPLGWVVLGGWRGVGRLGLGWVYGSRWGCRSGAIIAP